MYYKLETVELEGGTHSAHPLEITVRNKFMELFLEGDVSYITNISHLGEDRINSYKKEFIDGVSYSEIVERVRILVSNYEDDKENGLKVKTLDAIGSPKTLYDTGVLDVYDPEKHKKPTYFIGNMLSKLVEVTSDSISINGIEEFNSDVEEELGMEYSLVEFLNRNKNKRVGGGSFNYFKESIISSLPPDSYGGFDENQLNILKIVLSGYEAIEIGGSLYIFKVR